MTAEPDPRTWHPTADLKPGTAITVDVCWTTTNTFRWKPYKPSGARQMQAKGRWQRATEYGWVNAPLPDGEWTLNEAKE